MAIELTAMEQALFEEAKTFALKNIAPLSADWENGDKLPKEAFDILNKNGYCGLLVSEALGGRGLNFLESALIYEGLAHGCGTIAFMLQLHNNITYEIATYYDTSEAVKRMVPDMVSGKKLTAFAFTEESSGSDAASIQSYAELKEDGYHIHGKKSWIANALDADYFNVIVKKESSHREMLMLLVEKDTQGFTIGQNKPRMGGNGISCCDLAFQDCIVPKDRLLSEKGFKEALRAIDVARIFVPAIAIGIASRAIDMTVEYLGKRIAFNKPIMSNQGVQWTLAQLSAEVEAGRWLVYSTASLMDSGETVAIKAAMNKLFAVDLAMKVTTQCLQLFGANGYDRNSAISRYMSIAKLLQIIDGTSEIQKVVIGRSLERKVIPK